MRRIIRRAADRSTPIAATGIRSRRSPTTPRRRCASRCRTKQRRAVGRRRRRRPAGEHRSPRQHVRDARPARRRVSRRSRVRTSRARYFAVAPIGSRRRRRRRRRRAVDPGSAGRTPVTAAAVRRRQPAVRSTPRPRARRTQPLAQRGILGVYADAPRRLCRIRASRSRSSTIRCRAGTAPRTSRCCTSRCRRRPTRGANDPVSFDELPAVLPRARARASVLGQARSAGRTITSSGSAKASRSTSPLLYAERSRRADTFDDILRQMRRTAIAYADHGPIWLGYRLGHLQGDSRVFRALVYNKSAIVLHMLRRLTGRRRVLPRPAALLRAVALHEDRAPATCRSAFEAESGQPLDRFFERWICDGGDAATVRARVEARDGRPVSVRIDADRPARRRVTVTVTRRPTRAGGDRRATSSSRCRAGATSSSLPGDGHAARASS